MGNINAEDFPWMISDKYDYIDFYRLGLNNLDDRKIDFYDYKNESTSAGSVGSA